MSNLSCLPTSPLAVASWLAWTWATTAFTNWMNSLSWLPRCLIWRPSTCPTMRWGCLHSQSNIITRCFSRPSSHADLFCGVLQLKTDRELDKVKGLKLVELWLNRNPLCTYFRDQAAYIRSVSNFGGWVEKLLQRGHSGVTVCVWQGASKGLSLYDKSKWQCATKKRGMTQAFVSCVCVWGGEMPL